MTTRPPHSRPPAPLPLQLPRPRPRPRPHTLTLTIATWRQRQWRDDHDHSPRMCVRQLPCIVTALMMGDPVRPPTLTSLPHPSCVSMSALAEQYGRETTGDAEEREQEVDEGEGRGGVHCRRSRQG